MDNTRMTGKAVQVAFVREILNKSIKLDTTASRIEMQLVSAANATMIKNSAPIKFPMPPICWKTFGIATNIRPGPALSRPSCPIKINTVGISKGAYNTLRFLLGTSLDKIYRLNVSHDVKEELKKILTYIIASSYGRKPKSLELLNNLKE